MAPSTSTSAILLIPMRTLITPTEVSSPRKPERGKATSWRKSKPISARTSPAGTVSASVVRKGRSCAAPAAANKQTAARARSVLRMTRIVCKLQRLAKRIIQIRKRSDDRSLCPENETAQRGLPKAGCLGSGKFFVRPPAFRPDGKRHLGCRTWQNSFERNRLRLFRQNDLEARSAFEGIRGLF